MQRPGPLTGLLVLLAIVVAGHLLRIQLGLELSLEGLQTSVAALGWRGPLIYFFLVMFRQFLAIPAALILPVGGLCFGATMGTILGALGIIVSGLLKFGVARWVGREWVLEHFGEQFRRLEARIDRLGALVVGLSTAHPLGPLSPFHWGAGLSSVRFVPFAIALVIGAPVRAFAFSVFGASLTHAGSPEFIMATIGLTLVVLIPLAFPAVRRRLFASA